MPKIKIVLNIEYGLDGAYPGTLESFRDDFTRMIIDKIPNCFLSENYDKNEEWAFLINSMEVK
jgi:hypothetical protein